MERGRSSAVDTSAGLPRVQVERELAHHKVLEQLVQQNLWDRRRRGKSGAVRAAPTSEGRQHARRGDGAERAAGARVCHAAREIHARVVWGAGCGLQLAAGPWRAARGGACGPYGRQLGSSGFQLLPGGLLCITGPHYIGKASIPSVQQPQWTSALSGGRLAPTARARRPDDQFGASNPPQLGRNCLPCAS